MICQTAVVYWRKVSHEGKQITLWFHNDGRLHKRAFVMYDYPTNTHWNHALGKGLKGPLLGKTLTPIPSKLITWEQWSKNYPKGEVMSPPSEEEIEQSTTEPTAYLTRELTDYYFLTISNQDMGLAVGYGPDQVLIPMNLLQSRRIIENSFKSIPYIAVALSTEMSKTSYVVYRRRINNQTLKFRLKNDRTSKEPLLVDHQTQSVWNPVSGEAISGPLAGQELDPMVSVPWRIDRWQAIVRNGRIFSPD